MVCFLAYALEMALRQAVGKGTAVSEKDDRAMMEDLRGLRNGDVVSRRGNPSSAQHPGEVSRTSRGLHFRHETCRVKAGPGIHATVQGGNSQIAPMGHC